MPPVNEVLEWRGQTIVGSDGDKIGTIEEIYLDARDRQPEWAGRQHRPVRLEASASSRSPTRQRDGDESTCRSTRTQVKDAPNAEADGAALAGGGGGALPPLRADYSEARSDSGLPEGDGRDDGDGADDRDERATVGDDVSGPRPTTR